MGFFSKPHWQNPKHFAQNVHQQEPWKPQNPKHTLQGMNNVVGDQNAGEGDGFSPEASVIAQANAAAGNMGTPGRRPGLVFNRATGKYEPAPNNLQQVGQQVSQAAQGINNYGQATGAMTQAMPQGSQSLFGRPKDPNVMPAGMNYQQGVPAALQAIRPNQGSPGMRPGMTWNHQTQQYTPNRPKAGSALPQGISPRVNQVFGMLR